MEEGRPPDRPAAGTMARRLGEHLIDERLLSPRELDAALEAQRQRGGSLGSNLIAMGLLDEDTLARVLGGIYGTPTVSRAELIAAPREVVSLLSAKYAGRHRAIPFRVEGETLHLGLLMHKLFPDRLQFPDLILHVVIFINEVQ